MLLAVTSPTLVLDSASLYYRSYYALPSSMTASDGRPHQALRGFLSTLARLIEQHRPSSLVAAWDADWRPDWRVALLPGYKAHRVAEDGEGEAEPDDLGPQATAIADLLDALGVARWGVAGYEADDVIGSVTRQLPGPMVVVSGDRDLVQLIDDRTRLHLTVNGGMPGWPLLDSASAQERFGVVPDRYVDLAVLRGDPSDGLPGVPGIGAKTAAALVNAYGGCSDILAAARSDQPEKPLTPRLAGLLRENAEYLADAVQVASVVRDLELPGTRAPLPATAPGEATVAMADAWGVRRQLDEVLAAVSVLQT
ncbi:MAG: flap endonuclease [Actinomycetales bacterium]|nr:flap endonuclease [Actinomycetales bacterium]